MEVIEQIQFEVSERAGSPEGLLSLIRLLLREVEKIDITSPLSAQQYLTLLRAYVLVKRQLGYFNRRCEIFEVDQHVYNDTLRRLKYAIKTKRAEARQYAAKSIPPEKLKEIKRHAGTHMGFHPIAVATVFKEASQPYMGQRVRSGHSYNRM